MLLQMLLFHWRKWGAGDEKYEGIMPVPKRIYVRIPDGAGISGWDRRAIHMRRRPWNSPSRGIAALLKYA